ncbi:unnamed protein product [Penicillium salamii]|uniref:Uncharacterized protein n=1 Tax=Penicillium salamii TaxID=1612424 RepID=A0A9W4NQM8_9EURO|nr:unnamed protein product [Penicillium salamii]
MSFQDLVPSNTKRYRYEGHRQCLEVLEQEAERWEREEVLLGCEYNPYFIMDVDEASFLESFVNSGDKLLMLSWEIYDHLYQSALLKMESSAHAVAAGAFNTIFSAWARRVVDPLLSSTGTRTVRGQTRTKKADISWSPTEMPNGRSHKWPTFVGEVAWSERRTKLEADIKFWMNDPDSSRWKRNDYKPPSPDQKIEIVYNPRPGCPRVKGQLDIKFSDVCLRDKQEEESDFFLTATDMEELSRHIWA